MHALYSLYDALVSIGVSNAGAKTVVDAFEADMKPLATKEHVTECVGVSRAELKAAIDAQGKALRAEIEAQGKDLRAEIETQGKDLRAEIAAVRAELKAEINDLRTETRTEFAAVRAEIKALRTELKSDIELAVRATTIRLGSLVVAGVTFLALLKLYP